MPKIQIEVKDCRGCPHLKVETVYTADSFERPEKWTCMHPANDKPKVIDGWVDWYDEMAIPEWCPALIKTNEP